MVHFTCDLCGKDMTASGESRFVVRISAYPGFDPTQIREEDLEDDQLEAVSEVLQRDHDQSGSSEPQRFQGFRYDLCSCCHSKFVKDPLGKELLRSLDFSDFSPN